MKRDMLKVNKSRAGAFSAVVIAALIALVVTALSFAFRAAPTVTHTHAASGGSITIHVYDTKSEYSTLGGWVWVKGLDSGTPYKLGSTPLSDEEFKKDTNTARPLQVTLSDAQLNKLKDGTAFGLLILKLKSPVNENSKDFNDWFVKDGEQDVMVDLTKAFDDNNHADIYYVRKDTVAYTNIEDAKMALEKITSARFTAKTASGVSVAFETTSAMTNNATSVSILNGDKTVGTSKVMLVGGDKYSGTASFSQLNAGNFDFAADYKLKVEIIPNPASIAKTALIDDRDFIALYESADVQNLEYGAIYSKEKTVFRVWAPFAASVDVKLYSRGSGGDLISTSHAIKRFVDGKFGGVWELTVSGDLNGTYYTYEIDNYGNVVETIDPYAVAAGADGLRGMVVDLDSTDPDGWENDDHLYKLNPNNADVPIIWELVIKDFSASANSGMVNKGKYLAFTEKGTTVPGDPTLKTGVDYLKDLGITYVHLNPTYDFSSVAESDMSNVNSVDAFNWGYDPQNYNVPEGSYSTDPSRGEVRINEFKQMVMALHEAGIGVIMDVVYNHTYATGGQAFHNTVPSYYHRTDASGNFTNGSGCGNETASERSMVRKYMVESLVYWATEYHIDGFRFDLMGIHDVDTMKAIRSALDALDGGKGKQILIYGEPWSGDSGDYIPPSFTARRSATTAAIAGTGKYTTNTSTNKLVKQLYFSNSKSMSALGDRIAAFNGTGRDGVRGGSWDIDVRQGWINGNTSEAGAVKKMLEGGCGSEGSGMATSNGSQNAACISVHDNFTLWDHLIGKASSKETPLFYDDPIASCVSMTQTASAANLMSSGMTVFIAGEEMARTKYANHNSYNSPVSLNALDWRRQKDFKAVYDHYKQVIKIRKAYKTMFSYSGSVNKSNCTGNFTGSDASGLIVFTRNVGGQKLVCIFNPTDAAVSVSGMGGMKVYVQNGTVKNNTPSSASMSVAAKGTIILGSLTI
ncbi:MAG: hypothetical protein J1G04_01685 [Clostridiales bacterium]|nr:hypothetical protein [Clostridiales bacterium]